MSSFFFYDLETSGVNPRTGRIMQFGGQRTDMDLNPIGKPYNILIKMTDDVLPEPEAILITGITPQKTLAEGISEAEFTKLFQEEIATEGTIFTGFNSIRFDDEFMRFLFWRNFTDAYEWQWKDSRSRWDILDVTRMTRALRPKGVKWPVDSDGKPTNRLEYLTAINKLAHEDAHDALSDVNATIAVAKLIKTKQPKLFEYLLKMRNKNEIKSFASRHDMFVYSSGKYPGTFEKTTVVYNLGSHPDKNGLLVYDLRHNPEEYISLSPQELAKLWRYDPAKKAIPLPVKSLQFNRCPAIAPTNVLDEDCYKRLGLTKELLDSNRRKLAAQPNFINKLEEALGIINDSRTKSQAELLVNELSVDEQLYSRFVPDGDKKYFAELRASDPAGLAEFMTRLNDERLKMLLPLYKARNFPTSLTGEESEAWEKYRHNLLMSGGESGRLVSCAQRLEVLQQDSKLRDKDRFLLEELQLWLQRIHP